MRLKSTHDWAYNVVHNMESISAKEWTKWKIQKRPKTGQTNQKNSKLQSQTTLYDITFILIQVASSSSASASHWKLPRQLLAVG